MFTSILIALKNRGKLETEVEEGMTSSRLVEVLPLRRQRQSRLESEEMGLHPTKH